MHKRTYAYLKLLPLNLVFALVSTFALTNVCAQSGIEMGMPASKDYLPADYKANGQNFSIVADKRGVMFVANFAGVLEFDGVRWRTITTQNASKVNSLCINNKGIVFVGARGEIGYLKPNEKGEMQFVSLAGHLGKRVPFPDVIKCYATDDGVVFVTANCLILFQKDGTKVVPFTSAAQNAFYLQHKLYIVFKNAGLKYYAANNLVAVPGGDRFSDVVQVNAMLASHTGNIIIATGNEGLYSLSNTGISKFKTDVDGYLVKNIITNGTVLHDGAYALGTSNGGVVILETDGKLRQIYNKQLSGILDNNTNYLFVDVHNALWIAMSRGITRIDLDSHLSYFSDKKGVSGNVLAVRRFNNLLYIATTEGLFYCEGASAIFKPVPALQTACWALTVCGNSLLVATTNGVFSLDAGSNIKQVTQNYTLSLYTSKAKSSITYAGLINGLMVLNKNGSGFSVRQYPGIKDEINSVADDKENIWLDVPGKYLIKLPVNPNGQLAYYGKSQGLPGITAHTLNNTSMGILVGTKKGVYKYNEATDAYKQYDIGKVDTALNSNWVSKLTEDETGNFWITAGDDTHVTFYRKEGNKFRKSVALLPLQDHTIYTIYPDVGGRMWMGSTDELVLFANPKRIFYAKDFKTLIRSVVVNNDTVTLGDQLDVKGKLKIDGKAFPDTQNSFTFQFSTPVSIDDKNLRFHYYLQGYDKDSIAAWVPDQEKLYSNLPPGNYKFHVKSKNVYGFESKEATCAFSITTPYYQTIYAYIVYALLLVGIFLLVLRIRSMALVKEKNKLEELIRERTEEVVVQKEELEAQSGELAYKNNELEKINSIVKSINAEINFSSLMQTILEKTKIIQGAEKAAFLVNDRTAGIFRFKSSYGYNLMAIDKIELTLEEAETRYLSASEELYEDIYFVKSVKSINRDEMFAKVNKAKSVLIMLIRLKGKIEAFLILENWQKQNAFVERDFSLLKNLKEHFIAAFIKTTLLEDIQNTLTNLKDTQEQLIRHEKLASIGQLTKGIVDRILNPLNYINNFSLLSKDLISESLEIIEVPDGVSMDKKEVVDILTTVKSNLQKVNNHGTSASRIVKGMEKILHEKSKNYIVTDINKLVETNIELYKLESKKEYPEGNINVMQRFDLKAFHMAILPYELNTVIINLLSNAFYAVAEKANHIKDFKPEVVVSTVFTGTGVEISVRDNGKGISATEMKQLFQPFFTTKPTARGTGLGLYLSQDIVKEHKGNITVETKVGEYTEFKIWIPKNEH